MKYQRTVLDECIKWNRNKSKTATDPVDKKRYDENVANLLAYKEKM